GDAQDDEAAAEVRVEDAAAIAEFAGVVAQVADAAIFEVEHLHGVDGLGDFLTISADVLHRRASHAPGNAGKAFDTSKIFADDAGNEGVPLYAGAGLEQICAVLAAMVDPVDGDLEHQRVHTLVADHQI